MSKADTLTKDYLRNPSRAADLINGVLFGGEQAVKPETLKSEDTAVIALPYGDDMLEIPVQKFRDVLKTAVLMDSKYCQFLLIGFENQSDIHYAMPVRNMLYDAIAYAAQVQELARKHRKEKDLSGREFLSGISKKDRLRPVITLVINWDTRAWDAPEKLFEMLDAPDPRLLPYMSDYRINIVDPFRIEDYSIFQTDIKSVFRVMGATGSRESLSRVLKDPEYENVDVDAANLLKELTGLDILIVEKGGKVNMCKAVEDMKEYSRREGHAEGRAEGRRTAMEENVRTLMQTMNLTAEQAMAALRIPVNDQKTIKI